MGPCIHTGTVFASIKADDYTQKLQSDVGTVSRDFSHVWTLFLGEFVFVQRLITISNFRSSLCFSLEIMKMIIPILFPMKISLYSKFPVFVGSHD